MNGREHEELVEFLAEKVCDPDGAGSDLQSAERWSTEWVDVRGNLDISNLASDLLHAGYRKEGTK